MRKVVGIGSQQNESDFLQRHDAFFQRLHVLLEAAGTIFDRTITERSLADPVVFYLGIRVLDDFMSVMTLAAQDFGLSAMALMRGTYERLVVMAHLVEHPDDADRFAAFDVVQRYKAAQHMKQTIGIVPENEAGMKQLAFDFEQVRAQYEIPDCKKCDTKRLSVGWHRLDTVAMAHKHEALRTLLIPAYYVPLGQAHATLKSISPYMKKTNGAYTLKRDQREESDAMFRLAHLLLVHNFALQAKHFADSDLERAADQTIAAYFEVWPRPEPTSSGA